jgi:hypothetical protein
MSDFLKDVIAKEIEEKVIKKTEGRFQSECFQWFNEDFPHLRKLLFHVPNGGKRSKIEASQFTGMGVVKGVTDFVFLYKAKAYLIELKKEDGSGTISDHQQKFKEQVELHNFEHWYCDNLEQFKTLMLDIINRDDFEVIRLYTQDDFIYKSKIFNYLYSLDGQCVTNIADVCEEKNINKFISIVSEFIDYQYGHLDGFEILFTPDFKAFYKKSLTIDQEINYNGKTTI